MIWDLVILAGVLWIVRSGMSFLQNLLIRNAQTVLKKTGGQIYSARNAGFMRTRLLLFVAVDGDGTILDARALHTVIVLWPPRLSKCPDLVGTNIRELEGKMAGKSKTAQKAMQDLMAKYKAVPAGA